MRIKDFKKFEISDKEKLLPILLNHNHGLCDYNFANLYLWGSIHSFSWGFYKDALFVYDPERDFLTYGLGGNLNISDYIEISDQVQKDAYSGNFYLFPSPVVEANREELTQYFNLETNDYYSDYVYKSSKLVELKGKHLQKKKNLIAQFKRKYPNYKVRAISSGDYESCNKLAEIWCRASENCNEKFFIQEEAALSDALKNFEALSLEGLLLSSGGVEDELLAFSVFSELNSSTADIHFEKSDINVKGGAQVINWETAKYLFNRYEYLNREQDLGIEGLRQAKHSYVPEYQMTSFLLKRKK